MLAVLMPGCRRDLRLILVVKKDQDTALEKDNIPIYVYLLNAAVYNFQVVMHEVRVCIAMRLLPKWYRM